MKKLIRFIKCTICKFCNWRMCTNRDIANYARVWGSNIDEYLDYSYRATVWENRLHNWEKSLDR